MNNKLVSLLNRPKFKIPGIDPNRRLTTGFQKTLARSWVHPYVRARRFMHDYSLPVIMTAVFLLVVAGAMLLRISQQTSVAKLLAGVTTAGKDYGTLLSKDKTDELKKNDDNEQPNQSNPSIGSTRNSTSPAASGPSSTNSGSALPFSATINHFKQDDAVLECSSLKLNKPNCSKRYIFSASIRTRNGPGVVSYGWRSNVASANENSNYAAGTGEALKGLQKSFSIDCLSTGTYNLQLVVLSPTQTQSNVLSINHSCIGI